MQVTLRPTLALEGQENIDKSPFQLFPFGSPVTRRRRRRRRIFVVKWSKRTLYIPTCQALGTCFIGEPNRLLGKKVLYFFNLVIVGWVFVFSFSWTGSSLLLTFLGFCWFFFIIFVVEMNGIYCRVVFWTFIIFFLCMCVCSSTLVRKC